MENLNLKKQQLKHLKLNRIVLVIVLLIVSIVLFVIMYFKEEARLPLVIVTSVVILVYFLIYLYLGAAYKHFSYGMNDFGLYINKGVFWRRKIIIPRNRVQHTDVEQGPFERRYNLAELIVHTAGTRNASVKLPGILHADAETLRESLVFDESNDAV